METKWVLESKTMDFKLKKCSHSTLFVDQNKRIEKSFSNWGLMCDFDTCTKSYDPIKYPKD
jgi:hypothetical protein